MPLLPSTSARRRIHLRRILLEGWKREDGLWDIEARLTDTKDHDYPLASGVRRQGEPVHDMLVRVTIDREFNILAAQASSDAVPYPGGCDTIGAAYGQLVGLNLVRGFRRTVGEMFDGVRGCAHLTELLLALPTAAIQTFASEVRDNDDLGGKPFQIDRCHALESSTETVRRYYPRWYQGAAPAHDRQPAAVPDGVSSHGATGRDPPTDPPAPTIN
ncbi:MAG: DUF2889 domain-containing protein [Betaproteobacteria bacterium]|nr:DUF2889 domain-containing protein [Betaproteobacteria bacterium]